MPSSGERRPRRLGLLDGLAARASFSEVSAESVCDSEKSGTFLLLRERCLCGARVLCQYAGSLRRSIDEDGAYRFARSSSIVNKWLNCFFRVLGLNSGWAVVASCRVQICHMSLCAT